MKIASWARGVALLSSLAFGNASAADSGPNPLADHVRDANSRFKDVKVAVAEGYAPIPCTSGIDGGAMGVHYVNGEYLKDEVPDIKRPQAVMYEPLPGCGRVHRVQGTGLTGGPAVQLHRRPQSLRPGPVLRIARVGLEGEPARHVRGHESQCDMPPPDDDEMTNLPLITRIPTPTSTE